jgi:predicted transcriptional regulator
MGFEATSQQANSMRVPHDLASRLSTAAHLSGQSPEAFLREAISRLIDSTTSSCNAVEQAHHGGFVPQPQTFSIYE